MVFSRFCEAPVLQLMAGLLVLAAAAHSQAGTLRVGPDEAITRISEAARLARDGDTVLIMPGTYRGDVAVWTQRRLSIRGVGQRPLLVADGKSAEGKAIWVIRNGDIGIENIEFRGARAASGNGAGIRFERGRLLLRDCHFIDNQMGLLTGNDPASSLRIEDSSFSAAPAQFESLPHLLYVGTIGRFELSGSRFESGFRGHLVKSRARVNRIRYNWIVDGEAGRASYELDLPNGGDAWLVGNVIGQSAASENLALISFGVEGFRWPVNRLRLEHNTLINGTEAGAQLVRSSPGEWPAGSEFATRNNLLLGGGHLLDQLSQGRFGDRRAALPSRGRPLSPAYLREIAAQVAGPVGAKSRRRAGDRGLQAEFSWPFGTSALAPLTHGLPGAFQLR